MTLAFQPAVAANPFAAAINWLSGTMLGSAATTVAVIAVAVCGLLLLSGRIDVRRGVSVIFGCFVLFGASTIAAGIIRASEDAIVASDQFVLPAPPIYSNVTAAAPAVSGYDPYAGAAMPTRE